MGYDLHIERRGGALDAGKVSIPLDEWCAAVAGTEGVRIFAGPLHSATNPSTGEIIGIWAGEGDAEVYFPDQAQWHAVFTWRLGAASFGANFEPFGASHPIWGAAANLARRLGAVIRGDEGERYDLDTAEVGDA